MMPDIDQDFSPPFEWATAYRELGLQVVPAYMPKPDDPTFSWKRPIMGWGVFQDNLVPPETFDAWYGPRGKFRGHINMGVITGAASDNVFVIDLDIQKEGSQAALWWQAQLVALGWDSTPWQTWTQTTGGGGIQLFFRAPRDHRMPTNRTPLGVDIRGQGGFAMLPGSLHSSGRHYRWQDGLEPWEVDCMKAPQGLLDAIDRLVMEHGGHDPQSGGADYEKPPSPATDFDWLGNRVDGREPAIRDEVWYGLMEWCRQTSGSLPDEAKFFDAAWQRYERNTRPQQFRPALDNAAALEAENRGISLFRKKWLNTRRKYTLDQLIERSKEEAPKKPADRHVIAMADMPHQGHGTVPPVGPIRTFDFATLFLENIEEVPGYVEPDLLDYGGFWLIGGPPKAQKSMFLFDALVSMAVGRDFLSGLFKVPKPLKVFYLQAEMNEKLLRRRAKKFARFTSDEIDALASNLIVSDRFRMVLAEDGVRIAAELIKASFHDGPPDIIAFDPLANIYSEENENDNAQMMRFLTQRLEAVRQLVNPVAGVILVHHATKKSPQEIAKDPFKCVRGGGALRGHYDSGTIIFRKGEEGPEREMHFEMRGGEPPDPLTVKVEGGRFIKAASPFFKDDKKGFPDITVCRQILCAMQEAWMKGGKNCWSNQHNTGARYAVKIMAIRWGLKEKTAKELLLHWEVNKLVEYQLRDSHEHTMGLNVIGPIP
jgi:hypothetical protein